MGEAAGESAAVRIVQVRPGKRLCVWMCVACRPAGQSTTPVHAPVPGRACSLGARAGCAARQADERELELVGCVGDGP